MSRLSVCVPTANRPEMVARLLENLATQTLPPDEILIIDASSNAQTEKAVHQFESRYPNGVVRRLRSELGLTRQRNVGIDNSNGELVCMLDDDVLLDPDCLEQMVEFMESAEGQPYGGICAYMTNYYGRQLYRIEKLYHWLGVFEKLDPGTWLYCGEFLDPTTLPPLEGVYPTEFLPGGTTLWRREVFEKVRPDNDFNFDGEDKHFSLLAARWWKLGVLGRARLAHTPASGGVRKARIEQARSTMRNKAIILMDCAPKPSRRRYLAFLSFNLANLILRTGIIFFSGRWRSLESVAGSWMGLFENTVTPPRQKTSDV